MDGAPRFPAPVVHLEVAGGITVPLAFPVSFYGTEIRAIRLLPLTLDELEFVGALGQIGAADLLVPMAGLPRAVIGALRWPDVEALITSALDLCPPEVANAFRGAPDPQGAEPAPPPAGEAPEGAQAAAGAALGAYGDVPEVDPSFVPGEAALRDLMTDPAELEIR